MARHFDQELEELKALLLRMGGWAEEMIQKAVAGLLSRDAGSAATLRDDDREMDALELEVEDRCLTLLALRQPIATDLRFITASLHIATDLERMGDHAINMARSAQEMAGHPRPVSPPPELQRLADVAADMLRRALDAFVRREPAAAIDVCASDDEADALEESIIAGLQARMIEDSACVPACVQWILVARNLERVADLATNVAEEVIFIAQARVIKHRHEEPAT